MTRTIRTLRAALAEWTANGIEVDSVRLTRHQDRAAVAPGSRELRTRKTDAIALGKDELGNLYLLTPAGSTRQLLNRAEELAAGIA